MFILITAGFRAVFCRLIGDMWWLRCRYTAIGSVISLRSLFFGLGVGRGFKIVSALQMSSGLSKHTILVTTSTWRQGRLRACQFFLDLRLCSTNLIIDTVFLIVSKFPGLVEL